MFNGSYLLILSDWVSERNEAGLELVRRQTTGSRLVEVIEGSSEYKNKIKHSKQNINNNQNNDLINRNMLLTLSYEINEEKDFIDIFNFLFCLYEARKTEPQNKNISLAVSSF